MELVVDTNCLISALIKSGKSRELFCNDNLIFYSPEYIILETLAHKKEIIDKAGITEKEFNKLIFILIANIKVISMDEFSYLKDEALMIAEHPEDAPFLALALFKKVPLWSDDKGLKKQGKVKVYSTSELLDIVKTSGF